MVLRSMARCGIIGINATRVVAWFPSPRSRVLLVAAKEGMFCILLGSLVWRKSANRRYNSSDVPTVLLQSIGKVGVHEPGIAARIECLFANFSRSQSMISSRLWQFPVCSNTVFVENAATSWSSEGLSLFWNSIRMKSWLPPMSDNVCSSWSKLSIAPLIKEPGKIEGGTNTLWGPARAIICLAKPVSIRAR